MELNTEPLSRKPSKAATIYDAFRLNDVEKVDQYIAGGGCLVDADNEGLTFLHHCAAGKQIEPLRKLAEVSEARGKQLPVDAKDSSGWTALHYAADKGSVDIAEVLLNEGSNVNAKDEAKRTPLHLAANSGEVAMVELLIKRGAAKHFMNVAGWTALRYAEEGKHAEIIAVLAPTNVYMSTPRTGTVARGEGKPFSTVRLVSWLIPHMCHSTVRLAGFAAYQLTRKLMNWKCDGARMSKDLSYLTKVLRAKGHISATQSVAKVTVAPLAKGAIGVLDKLHLVIVDSVTKEETLKVIIAKSLGTYFGDVMLNVLLLLNERECDMYKREPLVPEELRSCGLMPTCFDAYVSWFGVGYILLEDLSSLRMVKPIVGVVEDDAIKMLEAIAHTHSLSWCNQELALKMQMHIRIFDCLTPIFVEKLLGSPSWAKFFEARPHFVRAARALQNVNFFNATQKVISGWEYHEMLTPSNICEHYCLTHGDARLDNCFFDDKAGEAKFIDWQVSIPHHPGTDVAWVLMEVQTDYFQFPSQDRFRGLLREYHTRLSGHLEKRGNTKSVITLEKFEADFPWMLVSNTHYLVSAIMAVFREGGDDVITPIVKKNEHVQTTDAAALKCYVDRTNAQLEAMVPASFFEGF